jgi:putative transposase
LGDFPVFLTEGGLDTKRKQYTDEQIISILKEHEAGMPAQDVIRKHGIANGTFYRWKSKFSGMEVSDARRLRELEDENRRLKRMVADLSLDKQMLEDVIQTSKKW